MPYDGYVDFPALPLPTWRKCASTKGAASLLYGPNALGGAINLVTRKPTEKLEGDIRAGLAATANRQQYALNWAAARTAGMCNWAPAIATAMVFRCLAADVRALPTSASNPSRTVLEDGGNRNNAYQTDSRISLSSVLPQRQR